MLAPRPLYQTAAHRRNQDRIAARFGSWLGCAGVPMPDLDHADAVYLFGQLYAEIKRRENPFRKYQTYSVSASKMLNARRLGRPTVLVIEWSDGVVGVLSAHQPDRFARGGRWDRGDPRDQELMAHYDIGRFKLI